MSPPDYAIASMKARAIGAAIGLAILAGIIIHHIVTN